VCVYNFTLLLFVRKTLIIPIKLRVFNTIEELHAPNDEISLDANNYLITLTRGLWHLTGISTVVYQDETEDISEDQDEDQESSESNHDYKALGACELVSVTSGTITTGTIGMTEYGIPSSFDAIFEVFLVTLITLTTFAITLMILITQVTEASDTVYVRHMVPSLYICVCCFLHMHTPKNTHL